MDAEVFACLVVGSNYATSLHGSSKHLTSPEDRQRFLALRNSDEFAAIVIGSNTAATEPYAKSPHPVFVYTRSSGLTPGQFIEKVHNQSAGRILCEGGVTLLHYLLREDRIDYLHLTHTPIAGDSHFFDSALLLEKMSLTASEQAGQTTFERYERASRRVE